MEIPSLSNASSSKPPLDSSSATDSAPARIHRKRRPRPAPAAASAVSVNPDVPSEASDHDSHSAAAAIGEPVEKGDGGEVASDTDTPSGPLFCAVCGHRSLGFAATLQFLCYCRDYLLSHIFL